ncbi:hypothetical protein JCM33374_g5002 [Metschnikowia sp. JCM 33374]|nr:hypothetical protein JCM33374_g5002 [Metschnikowia sp. JCM 33374]
MEIYGILKTIKHGFIHPEKPNSHNKPDPLLLITPSVSLSRNAVEEITKFVFQTLELTAFNILDLSVAVSYGLGVTSSSLVVNVGHEATQIVPVLGGSPIKYASKRLNVGGKTIEEELRKILPQLSEEQIVALKKSDIFEVMIDHEDSFYSLADLDETKNKDEDEIDVAKIVAEENGVIDGADSNQEDNDGKQNSELQTNSFLFGGQKISVGKERFQGTQKLIDAISEGIFAALSNVPDLDKRQECFDNLVFVGGTTNILGLKQAIVLKLCQDYLIRQPQTKNSKPEQGGVNSAILAYQSTGDIGDGAGEHNAASQVPSSIKLVKHPEYFPEWKKPKDKAGSWSDVYFLGGQIYAKQIYGANSNYGGDSFIDTDIYEERGPQAIWDVSL